jgi:hypothetical protein
MPAKKWADRKTGIQDEPLVLKKIDGLKVMDREESG